jgi:general secretion pathway protein A
MYHQYFGLTEPPFSIAVNPRYLFMSPRHRDALAHLLYGVGAGGGFILLTGEVGTGKTTINRCLLEQLPADTDIAIILNPALSAVELLASACDELGIDYGGEQHSLKVLTDKLHTFLLDNHSRGRKTVLLIDEAQHLDFDVLEQIRLLTNLETNSEKLLQIILIGQPELAQMLARPELRQLNQRITARYNLEPLNLEETGAYIRHRLQVAGLAAGRELFPPSVVRNIHRRTRGIPRLINLLCDRTLLGAYGKNASRANKALLAVAAAEVMGETRPESRGMGRLPVAATIAVIAAGLVLTAVAAGWFYLGQEGEPLAAKQPALLNESTIPLSEPLEVQLPEPVTDITPVAVTPVDSTSITAAEPEPLLSIDTAEELLWSLYSPSPMPTELCPSREQAGLLCSVGSAQTWDELQQFDRPILLSMITPDRFSAGVVLLSIAGRKATVAALDGVMQVELAQIGPMWTGDYTYLWHPPAGFSRPIALGDSGPVVGEVARLFARLDQQTTALAQERFNRALDQRVRLFQRDNGLADDGVVGERTLLKLNEQLSVDVTASQARQRLQAQSMDVVQQ